MLPLLTQLPPAVREEIERKAVSVRVPAGTVLFRPGDACSLYLLLTSGTVRVQMLAASGHQIVLYRVKQGETCVLTTSCLIAHEGYSAEGVAETDIVGLGLSRTLFEQLLADSAAFRQLVFSDFGHRLADLMGLLNEIAFRRIDARLAEWLLSASQREGSMLRHTHQDIAVELGTAREVVSRQLKDFERQSLVSLARGRIALRDIARLRQIASTAGRGATGVT